jgi:dTDP-4-dehydrorhamnose 3,5-epimerase
MTQFSIVKTPIVGLKVIKRTPVVDSRGYLARLFCAEQLKEAGWMRPINQINQTLTKKRGTVRGMHYQCPPYSEMKLVSCIRGKILDVAVDLRKNSPTFLQWHAEELSAENHRALLIPEGFAHGFQTLSDDCELLYLHSAPYKSDAEGGVRPTDPMLSIDWPLEFYEVSQRDAGHPLLGPKFIGIEL